MPARFAGRAACALGDQAQARRLPGLLRQLQPPPLTQIKRTGDLDHHQRDCSIPERLFGNREHVGLILGPRDQNPRRIADRREAHRGERSGLPITTQPEQRPLALRAGDSGKTGRTRPADLMDAGGTQGGRGVRCRGHRVQSYHIRKRPTGPVPMPRRAITANPSARAPRHLPAVTLAPGGRGCGSCCRRASVAPDRIS